MDDKNMQEMINHGVKKYFDEKEARELKAKLEAEATEQKQKAAKDREKNFALIGEIAFIIIALIGCYLFLKSMGVL